MLDAIRLAQLPRDKALPIHEGSRPFVCAICGVHADTYAWRVTLPNRAGPACPGCAADRGWTVQ